MSGPVWITPAGFLGTLSERRTISIPVVATGTAITYSLISGQLPTGVYLNPITGLLLGTPVSVTVDVSSTFVVRAKDSNDQVADRTFSFTTSGVDAPVWVTPQGILPIGLNGELYVINRQYVNYRLRAETDILVANNTLKYYIADNQGQLPPGLTLSQNGIIQGYVEDSLVLDSEASINGGYDTESYDQYPFEHNAIDLNNFDAANVFGQLDIINISPSNPCVIFTDGNHNLIDGQVVFIRLPVLELPAQSEPVELTDNNGGNGWYAKVNSANSIALFTDQSLTSSIDSTLFDQYSGGGQLVWGSASLGKPEFINKTYQFYVTVTDGIISTQRLFTIDVVDRNSLRVDNTLLSVDSEYVDSSAGYLLAPIWQSKYGDLLPDVYNLGSVRASRDQILTVYDYDPYPTDGPTVFNWTTLTVNPDIRLVADSGVGVSNLPTQNARGQNAIYFKDAEIIPVKGMQIRLSEYISGAEPTTYTITGVIKLSDSSGVLNIDQPLSQIIPDGRVFFAGTPSRRPVGLSLDPVNGNIYGKLAYQPAYSDSYRFTIQSVKINQQTADTTIFDSVGSNNVRIVGKRYFEGLTVSTTATMTTVVVDNLISEAKAQLPDPINYSGLTGDIILVGISDNVIYNDLLAVMGGTTYAFVYTETDDDPRWEYVGETVSSSQIYILTVLGEVFSSIEWISTSSLGSIRSGEISELAVKAVNTNTNYSITYELISGQLPDGLYLSTDGAIQGKITNTGQTYFDFATTTATFVGSISQNVLTVNTVTSGSIVAHQSISVDSIISTSTSTVNLTTATFIIAGAGNTWTVSDHNSIHVFEIVSPIDDGYADGTQFNVTNIGAGAYSIDSFSNPPISLTRGFTYYFNINASGHPFWIKDAYVTGLDNQYNSGITNNGAQSGIIIFTVPLDAPDTLYYICQFHGSMGSTLTINDLNTGTTSTYITTSSISVPTSMFNATTLSPYSYSNQLLTIDAGQTTVNQNYYFTIRASDAYRLSAVEREFYITVNTDTLTEYTRMYVKPFLTREKRNSYRDFVSDSLIFDPVLIYRPFDPEFGIQGQIKMLLETGIEKVDLDLYAEAMTQYFYRKRFYFGEVKSILAQDQSGNDVYEIIYVDIIDDQMIGSDYVGVSVENMKDQLEAITIDGNTVIVDERLQPKYMTTLDADTGVPLGFIKAVPICYTIPGGALKILSRINNAINTGQFNFNNYNFDTDRIVVETVKGTEQTGWLAYPTERR